MGQLQAGDLLARLIEWAGSNACPDELELEVTAVWFRLAGFTPGRQFMFEVPRSKMGIRYQRGDQPRLDLPRGRQKVMSAAEVTQAVALLNRLPECVHIRRFAFKRLEREHKSPGRLAARAQRSDFMGRHSGGVALTTPCEPEPHTVHPSISTPVSRWKISRSRR